MRVIKPTRPTTATNTIPIHAAVLSLRLSKDPQPIGGDQFRLQHFFRMDIIDFNIKSQVDTIRLQHFVCKITNFYPRILVKSNVST